MSKKRRSQNHARNDRGEILSIFHTGRHGIRPISENPVFGVKILSILVKGCVIKGHLVLRVFNIEGHLVLKGIYYVIFHIKGYVVLNI
jgi:hypothetical protein